MIRPDNELFQEFCAGNVWAFTTLYQRYKVPLYRFVLKMVRDPEIAADVVQDVFLSFYRSGRTIRSGETLRTWLFTSARNRTFTLLKRDRREEAIENIEDPVLPDEEGNAQQRLENQEVRRLIVEAISKLPESMKEVVILREYHELSYEEIARITSDTLANVKNKLFRARKKLFEMLQPYFQ